VVTAKLKNFEAKNIELRAPRLIIGTNTVDFTRIIQAFQDLRYIGEMKQRWEEIKLLTSKAPITASLIGT
jgi:hypothetical protein